MYQMERTGAMFEKIGDARVKEYELQRHRTRKSIFEKF
jgi:hypothetical protein